MKKTKCINNEEYINIEEYVNKKEDKNKEEYINLEKYTNTEEYLRILTEQIRCKNARKPVEKEIRDHIEDQIEMNRLEGMDETEAVEAAIMDMGDPVEVGVSLDRIHCKKMPWKEIMVIGLLGIGGLVLQYLLQNIFQPQDYFIPVNIGKQVLFFIISFGLMVGTCCFDYSWIGYYAKELMIILTVGLIIGRKLFGVMVNGSARWIHFGGVTFNIPMLLLLFVPLYGGILYSYRGQKYKGIIKSILWMLPGIGIALMTRSMIIAAMLLFIFGILLSVSVMKNWYEVSKRWILFLFWGSVLVVPVMIFGYLVLSGTLEIYQSQRLKLLFSLADGEHFILNHIRGILANSSWMGTRETLETILVEEHILTYLLSYYGVFTAIVLIGVLSVLFIHLYSISIKQKNQMGMLMGTGCACVFILEFILYLLENLGIMYVGYLGTFYCPFLTYGGSGMMVTYILFGIILSINRYEKVYPESRGKRKISIKIKVVD